MQQSVTRIAREFELSKPTVSNMLDVLEGKGLAKRQRNGRTSLTKHGANIVDELMEKYHIVFGFLTNELGLPERLAEKDALFYICEMSPECVGLTVQHAQMVKAMHVLRGDLRCTQADGFADILPDGVYHIPFTVYQKNCDRLSMGDRGFKKPARLTVSQGRGVLTLMSQEIRYRSALGILLRGSLDRLNYWDGERYSPARAENNQYTFPVSELRFSRRAEDGRLSGFVRIQAAASVGIVNMPISEADMELYFGYYPSAAFLRTAENGGEQKKILADS
jgi:DNA-binding MarR family transcriptional regulator